MGTIFDSECLNFFLKYPDPVYQIFFGTIRKLYKNQNSKVSEYFKLISIVVKKKKGRRKKKKRKKRKRKKEN